MTRQDDDREGAKPYKTYKARRAAAQPGRRRARRRAAGARSARPPTAAAPPRRAPDVPARSPTRRTARYGPAPENGRKAGKKKAKQERRPGSAPPAPLPLVVRPRRRLRRCSSSPGWSSPSWPGPGTRSSTGPSTRPTSASTRRPAPSSPPTTAGSGASGTTVLLFGLDDAGLPGALGHDHAHALRPRHAHDQPALDPPRHAASNVDGYGQSKITQAMWYGGPVAGPQDRQGVHRDPHQPRHGRGLPGLPPARQRRRAASTCTCRRRSPPGRAPASPAPPSASSPSTKGMHHFDGKNAMLYVRIRKAYAEGDFTRAARQQAFVQALQKKIVRAVQHHQAARDRQALHERRRHRPHHQPDPRARLPQVARHRRQASR